MTSKVTVNFKDSFFEKKWDKKRTTASVFTQENLSEQEADFLISSYRKRGYNPIKKKMSVGNKWMIDVLLEEDFKNTPSRTGNYNFSSMIGARVQR
ncbi:hypothetical protein YT28_03135 [Salmonella enterica subsp. salamae]|nr:hypothetical protein [Salmonella enterica subsp. salamae]EDW4470753.1 hypothetical protein [Salmonella enterica subsp. salamae]